MLHLVSEEVVHHAGRVFVDRLYRHSPSRGGRASRKALENLLFPPEAEGAPVEDRKEHDAALAAFVFGHLEQLPTERGVKDGSRTRGVRASPTLGDLSVDQHNFCSAIMRAVLEALDVDHVPIPAFSSIQQSPARREDNRVTGLIDLCGLPKSVSTHSVRDANRRGLIRPVHWVPALADQSWSPVYQFLGGDSEQLFEVPHDVFQSVPQVARAIIEALEFLCESGGIRMRASRERLAALVAAVESILEIAEVVEAFGAHDTADLGRNLEKSLRYLVKPDSLDEVAARAIGSLGDAAQS